MLPKNMMWRKTRNLLKRCMQQEKRNTGGNVPSVERVGRHKLSIGQSTELDVHIVPIQSIERQMKPIVWQRNAPSFWLCGISKTTTRTGIPPGTPVLIRAESFGGYALQIQNIIIRLRLDRNVPFVDKKKEKQEKNLQEKEPKEDD